MPVRCLIRYPAAENENITAVFNAVQEKLTECKYVKGEAFTVLCENFAATVPASPTGGGMQSGGGDGAGTRTLNVLTDTSRPGHCFALCTVESNGVVHQQQSMTCTDKFLALLPRLAHVYSSRKVRKFECSGMWYYKNDISVRPSIVSHGGVPRGILVEIGIESLDKTALAFEGSPSAPGGPLKEILAEIAPQLALADLKPPGANMNDARSPWKIEDLWYNYLVRFKELASVS